MCCLSHTVDGVSVEQPEWTKTTICTIMVLSNKEKLALIFFKGYVCHIYYQQEMITI